jgi:hypothetical protein
VWSPIDCRVMLRGEASTCIPVYLPQTFISAFQVLPAMLKVVCADHCSSRVSPTQDARNHVRAYIGGSRLPVAAGNTAHMRGWQRRLSRTLQRHAHVRI